MPTKSIVRVLVLSGEESWIERSLLYSAVKPGTPYVTVSSGRVEELYRGEVSPEILAEALAMMTRGVVGSPK